MLPLFFSSVSLFSNLSPVSPENWLKLWNPELQDLERKNTSRDGGSTTQWTACTLFTLFTLFHGLHCLHCLLRCLNCLHCLLRCLNCLHCFYHSYCVQLKIWSDITILLWLLGSSGVLKSSIWLALVALFCNWWMGWDGLSYPLDYESTCGANNYKLSSVQGREARHSEYPTVAAQRVF